VEAQQQQEEAEVETAGERLCVGVDGLFDAAATTFSELAGLAKTTTAAGRKLELRVQDEEEALGEVPAALARACTCAAASFICRAPAAVTARLTRQTRERARVDDSSATVIRESENRRAVEASCGVPCEVPDGCNGGGGGGGGGDAAEGACIGPVCQQVCAACVGAAAAAAGTVDVPFDGLRDACGVGLYKLNPVDP
jgi:hypothetical protein